MPAALHTASPFTEARRVASHITLLPLSGPAQHIVLSQFIPCPAGIYLPFACTAKVPQKCIPLVLQMSDLLMLVFSKLFSAHVDVSLISNLPWHKYVSVYNLFSLRIFGLLYHWIVHIDWLVFYVSSSYTSAVCVIINIDMVDFWDVKCGRNLQRQHFNRQRESCNFRTSDMGESSRQRSCGLWFLNSMTGYFYVLFISKEIKGINGTVTRFSF